MKIFATLSVLLLIAGCGEGELGTQIEPQAAEEQPTEAVPQTTEADEPQSADSPLQNPGDTANTEAGKMTLISIARPEQTIETGPFIVRIGTISVVDLEPNESSKALFDEKERVTMISIAMTVENTSEDTISFHPNQGTIVTNTKEQQAASIFISDQVGGEFIGQVVKEGKVLFTLNSEPDEISSITYVIEPPFSSNFEQVGDKVTLDFTLSPNP